MNQRRVGRPSDPALTERLVDAGWRMFLAHGVEASAVEAIAAAANVSKVTFYKHFATKAALFEAAVLREMERIEAAQRVPEREVQGEKLEVALRQFGIGLMEFLCTPTAVNFYQVLAGELAKNKKLARRFYELGPGRTKANLAKVLQVAAEKGKLDVEDAEVAAEQLIGLWQGITNYGLMLGVNRSAIRAEIPERVEAGIRVFMRAYGRSRRGRTVLR